MNSRELDQRVKEKYPLIKVIFMLDYTSEMIASQGVRQPGEAFLQKPLSPMYLAGRIRVLPDNNAATIV